MPRHEEYLSYERPAAVPALGVAELAPTPPDILGPFYKEGAPEREDISEGLPRSFVLHGSITDRVGAQVAGALLDFWQADPQGDYDNDGYRHRGKVMAWATRAGAGYALRTVRPGCYDISEPDAVQHEYRCPHIHVKVTAPGCKPLTTQLYFADGEHNDEDRWFDPRRLIRHGRFDFVLERE